MQQQLQRHACCDCDHHRGATLPRTSSSSRSNDSAALSRAAAAANSDAGGGSGGSAAATLSGRQQRSIHSSSSSSSSNAPRRCRATTHAAAPRPLLATALALALALALAAPRPAAAFGTEISPSVALFRFVDLEVVEYLSGANATRCVHMVNRAGRVGSRRLNFVVSHFFVDEDRDFAVDRYCLKLSESPECTPATPELIARWLSLFRPCLQYAVDLGFDIAFTPHLDDGANSGQWRNAMRINPLERHEGVSYYDLVLRPLAEAMRDALRPGTYVWFALQGEMSAMVTHFPREHARLLPHVKSLILNGRDALADRVRVGVSTNFNKLCGMDACTKADVARLDAAAVRALYGGVDFVGISAYPRYHGKLSEMEDSTRMFDEELKLFGVDLARLVNAAGKELVFNEFGTGGGASVTGDAPARTLAQAADGPFFGVYGPYTRKLDPWRLFLPYNVAVGTRAFMHEWWEAAALWLARKGGPTWRVDHVFMWNLNSWDLLGVHMESTTKEGSYRDEAVYRTIRGHNLRARGMSGFDAPGSLPPY